MEINDLKSITVEIPVRVTMTSYDDAPFEFTSSIDEAGQIVLTPTSKYVEFIDANTDMNVDYDIPVAEQETTVEKDGNLTTRSTSILLHANMIAENNNTDVSVDVDEIGQCVIWPVAKENTFVSATLADSLNLITEETKSIDYFGYTLINKGDGWDIKDYCGELIDEGVATEAEAKVVVLTTELKRVEQLVESIDTETVDKESEDNIPDVEAEVLEERVDNISPVEIFDDDHISQVISQITNQYTEFSGGVSCDTHEEKAACLKLLQLHYKEINVEKTDCKILIYYAEPHTDNSIIESLEDGNAISSSEASEND